MTRFAFVTYAALVLLLGSLTTSTTDALSLRDFLTEYVEPKELAADTNAVGIPVPPVPPKLRGINATDTILFDVDEATEVVEGEGEGEAQPKSKTLPDTNRFVEGEEDKSRSLDRLEVRSKSKTNTMSEEKKRLREKAEKKRKMLKKKKKEAEKKKKEAEKKKEEAEAARKSEKERMLGAYKASLTIDTVCNMGQFRMMCDMMGLRSAFGDVTQNVYMDFNEEKKQMYIKADGNKALFKFGWCGPVGYDLDEEAVSKGKPAEIRLSKKEPECLKKFRKQLKNDSYYFDKKSKTIKVTAKIMPHKVVGWVDGGLDFKDCSSKECIKS